MAPNVQPVTVPFGLVGDYFRKQVAEAVVLSIEVALGV